MKEYKLSSSKDKSSGITNVSLEGNLNVAHVAAIHIDLQKALKGTKKIALTIENIEDADVSTIQLLKAFQNSCITNKVEVTYTFNLPEDIDTLLKKSGFSNIF